MKKYTVAAFDFDGTITRKDTLIEFLRFTSTKPTFFFNFILLFPVLIFYRIGILPNHRAKQIVFSRFFKGLPIEDFNVHCDDFAEVVDTFVKQESGQALNGHIIRGDRVVIVSASIENWVIPWARSRGVEFISGTKIETDAQGVITGRFASKNCYGAEKVNRLLELFPDRKDYFLVAYGDSAGDRELLEFADEGVWCNK